MTKNNLKLSRREFLSTAGKAAVGAALARPASGLMAGNLAAKKTRLAIVGTGVRACGMFGRDLLRDYSDYVEIVGLCDINPGRVKYAKKYIGAQCSTFTDLDKMLGETKPGKLLVTTVDATHHEQIIRGLEFGVDVITEKPTTTDEVKA